MIGDATRREERLPSSPFPILMAYDRFGRINTGEVRCASDCFPHPLTGRWLLWTFCGGGMHARPQMEGDSRYLAPEALQGIITPAAGLPAGARRERGSAPFLHARRTAGAPVLPASYSAFLPASSPLLCLQHVSLHTRRRLLGRNHVVRGGDGLRRACQRQAVAPAARGAGALLPTRGPLGHLQRHRPNVRWDGEGGRGGRGTGRGW